MRKYSIKSCGKAHNWCKQCRPEISSLISEATKKGMASETGRFNYLRGLEERSYVTIKSPEYGIFLSKQRTGRKMSEKGKANCKEAQNRPEVSAKRRASSVGRVASAEAKRNQSIGYRRHMEQCDGSCGSAACGAGLKHSGTSIEITLWEILLKDFPEMERSKRFGRYVVDAFLPDHKLAFEADGTYWHSPARRKPGYDEARDLHLFRMYGITVVRITEDELRRIKNVQG